MTFSERTKMCKKIFDGLGIYTPTVNNYKTRSVPEQIPHLSETCTRNNDLFPVNIVTELFDPTTGKKYRVKFELEETLITIESWA